MNLRHIDLFSGFGGGTLAARAAGIQTVAACEIDKDAISVYRRHFPDVPVFVDITKPHDWPACDVVTFGSPCQDTSIAGKRVGLKGKRSGLFYAAVDLIGRLRERDGGPRWAVWEQPPGVFSSNGGRDFAAVLDALLDGGARDLCWRVLDAQFFGVPQRRRRIFLVADFGGERAHSVLFESEGLRGDITPSREAREDAAARVGGGSEERGWLPTIAKGIRTPTGGIDREDMHTLLPVCGTLAANGGGLTRPAGNCNELDFLIPAFGETARGLTSRNERIDAETENFVVAMRDRNGCEGGGKGLLFSADLSLSLATANDQLIAHPLRSEGADASEDGTGRGTPLVIAFDWQSGGDVRHNVSDKRTSHLSASQTPAVAYHRNASCSVTAQEGGDAALRAEGEHSYQFVHTPMAVRRLTSLECERLMAVPDRWTAEGVDGPLSDSARYRLLGNGLVWLCLAPILQAIAEHGA